MLPIMWRSPFTQDRLSHDLSGNKSNRSVFQQCSSSGFKSRPNGWLTFNSVPSLQILHRITFVNPPAITPEWKRKVAQDAIESLSAAKLARSICSQFRTRLNSSHEAFAASLRQVHSFPFFVVFFPFTLSHWVLYLHPCPYSKIYSYNIETKIFLWLYPSWDLL